MITNICLVLVIALSSPSDSTAGCPAIHNGYASRYDPGVMENTIWVRQFELRQLPKYIGGYDGFAATLDCSYIGKVVLARPDGRDRWDRLLITDCAQRNDGDGTQSWMSENSILLEVDYATGQRWLPGRGGIPIQVIFDGAHPVSNHMYKQGNHRPEQENVKKANPQPVWMRVIPD